MNVVNGDPPIESILKKIEDLDNNYFLTKSLLYLEWRRKLHSQLAMNKNLNRSHCKKLEFYLKKREELLSSKKVKLRSKSFNIHPHPPELPIKMIKPDDEKEEEVAVVAEKEVVEEEEQEEKKRKFEVSEQYSFTGIHHIFSESNGTAINIVKFANNNKDLLAFSGLDGYLYVCAAFYRPRVLCRLNHDSMVTDFDWSLVNDLIISTGLDGRNVVWNIEKQISLRVFFEKPGEFAWCCRFHPFNNNIFAVGTSQGFVRLYNLSTGICVFHYKSKQNVEITSLEFDNSGNHLFVGDDKGFIHVFYSDQKHNFSKLFLISKEKVSANLNIVPNPKSKSSASCSISYINYRGWGNQCYVLITLKSGCLKLYDFDQSTGRLNPRSKVQIKNTKNENIHNCFCPLLPRHGSACIVSGSIDSNVYIYDILRRKNDLDKPLNILQGHATVVYDVSWNCDESLLASCDANGFVYLWKRVVLKKTDDIFDEIE